MGQRLGRFYRTKSSKDGKICAECRQRTTTMLNWCQKCNSYHFRQNFSNWTSGNSALDKLIQDFQIQAGYNEQVMEWIPFERFRDLKYIARGGFGEVYHAIWDDGQIYNWDLKKGNWNRRGAHPVALKRLKGSEKISEDFLNELKSHHSVTRLKISFEVAHCFGISQDPTTKEYIIVMSFAENGSLHSFLKNQPTIDWPTRANYLLKIAQGLDIIHNAGLMHRDFHSGNILVGKRYPMVSDFGLSRPVGVTLLDEDEQFDSISQDETLNINFSGSGDSNTYYQNSGISKSSSNDVYGVIPYIAPEVLNGNPYTPRSDIYSFGMIMYELLTLRQPFHDIPHDVSLMSQIITQNLRPSLNNIYHPKCWIHLMKRCWDEDPAKRPSSGELKNILDKWYVLISTSVSANRVDLSTLKDFRDAEFFRIESSTDMRNLLGNGNHKDAVYTSRLIPTMSLAQKMEQDESEVRIKDEVKLQLDDWCIEF